VIRVGKKLENDRIDVDILTINMMKVKKAVTEGKTTYNKEVYKRREEMQLLNKARTGDRSMSGARKYNESVDFILKEIQLIRFMEAGLL
jgi:hypothetical protein